MEVASSPAPPTPPHTGIKKVFSKGSRSHTSVSEVDGSSTKSQKGPRTSIDSGLERLKTRTSGESSRGDESSKSGSSGIRKLVPGHRRRKKKREEAKERQADEQLSRVRSTEANSALFALPPTLNTSESTLENDAGSSLMTEDSDLDLSRPPLNTRDSHTGYVTASSPLIHASIVPEIRTEDHSNGFAEPRPQTAATLPTSESAPAIDTAATLQHANTLSAPTERPRSRRKSLSSGIRGISPGTKIKDILASSKGDKSPRISPDRDSRRSSTSGSGSLGAPLIGSGRSRSGSLRKNSQVIDEPIPPLPDRSAWLEQNKKAFVNTDLPVIITAPKTPPSSGIPAPLTTVTPPTPTLEQNSLPKPPSPKKDIPTISVADPPASAAGQITISPSGNMISHRRVRSTSAVNQPSKLSNSVVAPLTPTIEEKTPGSRTPSNTSGGGFFSSVFSVAQNAASSLSSSLNTQSRNRSGTVSSDPEKEKEKEKDKSKGGEGNAEESSESTTDIEPTEQKKLAVETLGTGDLNFGHLGIEYSPQKEGNANSLKSVDLGKEALMKKDEETAQTESERAARAVFAAYDAKSAEPGVPTPIAEDVPADIRPRSTFGTLGSGEHTPPNGSIFEGDAGSGPKRSNSVRSRITRRRHRGSSGATTGTTIGAMVGASTFALANPAAQTSQPRLTGFAVASKKRNRDFHQLFRSVPEDDYLIEDYSCALQREILLAGRIYISEGHICFSSNILGWVTTLVISFDEVMSIEKENTAVVFPNAIAIQTLHARHTFRSLLSRESTYDLLINIWKISHPGLISSANGSRLEGPDTGDKTEKREESDPGSELSSDDDEIYDEDAEDEGVGSFVEAGDGSVAGSDGPDSGFGKRPSAIPPNGISPAPPYPQFQGDAKGGEKAGAAGAEASADYPGPSVHAPTECADVATHYEKVIKDDVVPAPLGKVYSMIFGPASGVFMTRYLADDQKVTDLQLTDDKKGLGPGTETRSFSYIKPLYGSIGPKQTKCIITEALDAFDLDRAISVTATTQTPDVPSGNLFSVKTKYCLSWGPSNGTRIQMNCTIEWTGKSWLKGPIEKGANEGQISYGTDLIKALKAGLTSRARAATAGSKGTSGGGKGSKGKRRKGDGKAPPDAVAADAEAKARKEKEESWGAFEPLRGLFGPLVSIVVPLVTIQVVVGILCFLVLWLWWRGAPSAGALSGPGAYPGFMSSPERWTAFEEIWQREEVELWDWLEERVGMGENVGYPTADDVDRQARRRTKNGRARVMKRTGDDIEAKLREERMSEREMEDAIRVTQERLDLLRGVVERKKEKRQEEVIKEAAE